MSGPDQPLYQPPQAPPPGQEHQAPPAKGGTPGSATASLVLGILGLLVCTPIASPLAVIYGNKAKREIAASPGTGGEGLAKAGVILGYVGLALLAIGLVIVVAILLAG